MSEKKLVGLEVGSKGTVTIDMDESMTTKGAVLQLFVTTLQAAQMQGFVDGTEVKLIDVIEKLKE